MKEKIKYTVGFFIVFSTIILLVDLLLYNFIEQTPALFSDPNLIERRIDTPIKLFLNGYFGVFFNFMYSGNILWVFLPIASIYFLKADELKYEKWPFFIFLIFSFFLIAFKGYFNERYQLTLVPFFLLILFLGLYKVVEIRLFNYLMSFFLVLSILNFGWYFYTNFYSKHIQKEKIVNTSKYLNAIEIFDLTTYIKDSLPDALFLVNNIPDFYYETSDIKGYYYSSDHDILYLSDKKKQILSDSGFVVGRQMIDSLNIQYVYTTIKKNFYKPQFEKFLLKNSDLILKDYEGRLLFKIK